MRKRFWSWQIFFALALIAFSAFVYGVHFLIFRDAHHIFIYLVGDIAFVFLEVLLVTLVLHQVLAYREKKSMMNKLNMVIGAFYSEVGTELLKAFSLFDSRAAGIMKRLVVNDNWSEKDFIRAYKSLKEYNCDIDPEPGDLEQVREILKGKRQFLLNLLENPNLLEHESFTDLLWAVFHLLEELTYRYSLKDLPASDRDHLTKDIERAYVLLIREWLDYMGHLKGSYPYLFSLAMRTNPFDADSKIEVSV